MAEDQMRLNLAPLKKVLHKAVDSAVSTVANKTYIEAQKRVPVRKVFRGGRQRTRALTIAETHAEIGGRIRLADSFEKRMQILRAPAQIRTRVGDRPTRANRYNPYHLGFGSSFLAERRADPLANARFVEFSSKGSGRKASLVYGQVIRDPETGALKRKTGVAQALSGRGLYELEQGSKGGRLGGVYQPEKGPATLGGRLKRQIRIGDLEHAGSITKQSVISPTPYAKYVEFGTRHAAAQPYLRPSMAMQREGFRTMLNEQLVRATKGMARPRGFAAQATPKPKPVKTARVYISRDIQEMFNRKVTG